jgi:hypothetical protein
MPRTRKSQTSAEAVPETVVAPEPAPREGRETNGRFAKGNKGGPGNPFARQVAALRKQLVEAVTPEVMAQIVMVLLLRAQSGQLAAIKLLFTYVLGRPAEAVNPDTLDHDEMELFARDLGMDELLGKVLLSVPAELACECVRVARPDIIDRVCEAAARHDPDGLPRGEQGPPAGQVCDQPGPSANGGNDTPEEACDPAAGPPPGNAAPMANGANGGAEVAGVPAAAPEAGEEAPIANGGNRRAAATRPGPVSPVRQRPVGTGSDRQGPPGREGEREAPPRPSGSVCIAKDTAPPTVLPPSSFPSEG